ncbi:MAG TPA: DMT family transporter [Acidimicrobiales bacterium]|nr:DMT family transporter [Acidimicrobiales bacterium]
MLAGVLIALVSTIFYNVGFVAEKSALDRLPPVHARRAIALVRTVVGSPLWLGGFVLLLVGLAFQLLALSLAPLSVVQPIFTSGIVLLLLLSRLHLREELTASERVGVAFVVSSLVVMSVSLDSQSDVVGTKSSLVSIGEVAAPALLVALLCFVGTTRVTRNRAALFAVSSGLLYGVAGLATKQMSAVVKLHGLTQAMPRVLGSADPYLFVSLCAMGLLVFQTGLQRSRASLLVPVSNVISSGFVVVVGTPLFGEHLPGDPVKLVLRLVGVVGILCGMVVLTRSPHLEDAGVRAIGDGSQLVGVRQSNA